MNAFVRWYPPLPDWWIFMRTSVPCTLSGRMKKSSGSRILALVTLVLTACAPFEAIPPSPAHIQQETISARSEAPPPEPVRAAPYVPGPAAQPRHPDLHHRGQ